MQYQLIVSCFGIVFLWLASMLLPVKYPLCLNLDSSIIGAVHCCGIFLRQIDTSIREFPFQRFRLIALTFQKMWEKVMIQYSYQGFVWVNVICCLHSSFACALHSSCVQYIRQRSLY